MSALSKIEIKIRAKRKEIAETYDAWPAYSYRITGPSLEETIKKLNAELDILEGDRRFLLDRRESWMPKTLWNVLVPILISITVTLLAKFFQ